MSQIVTNNGLSYVGVRSTNPPQLTFQKREPTDQDTASFKPGDQWIVNNPLLAPPISIWILGGFNGVSGDITAEWVQVYPGPGAGGLVFNTVNGIAIPAGGVISFTNSDGNLVPSGFGAAVNYRLSDDINLNGSLAAGSNIFAADNISSVNGNLDFPITTSDVATGGYITQNSVPYSHSYGTQNTFLGIRSGNPAGMTIAATDNTASGYLSLSNLTSGAFNIALGSGSLVNATTDSFTTAIGAQSLLLAAGSTNNLAIGTNAASNLTTGSYNCIVGTGAGIDYAAAESSNILLGNAVEGTLGESNTIRIGNQGSGNNQQNRCFIAGIEGVVINPVNLNAVTIDVTTGQLGSQPSSVLGGVNFTTTSGPTGTLSAVTLTGAGGIAITSAGSTITFTGGGGGGGTVDTLTGNTGGAVSPTVGNTVNTIGAGTVSITGNPGTNTLTTAITGGTLHQVLQSAGAGNAVFSTATYPATSAQGDLMISSAANTYTNLAKDTNATRYLSNTGLGNNPAWAQVNLANSVTGTLQVPNGGTGKTTFTAYSVITAGTTATGDFQNVVGVGTAGQVLMSNGAATLPSWQTIGTGSGFGLTWNVNPSNNTVMVANHGYISISLIPAIINVQLPTVSAIGAALALAVANSATANLKIIQAAGQRIWVNSSATTVGTGGSLTIGAASGITLVCTVANTEWQVLGNNGTTFIV